MTSGDIVQAGKAIGDVLSLGVVVSTLLQVMPAVAAVLAVVWWCYRIRDNRRITQLQEKKLLLEIEKLEGR